MQVVHECLPGVDQAKVLAEPILFTNFCNGEDTTYLPCPEYPKLNKVLDDKLHDYMMICHDPAPTCTC